MFPSLTAEYSNDWIDRAGLGRPFLLDRVLISDRAAAMQGKNYHETSRPSSEAFSLPESSHWWLPITTSAMEFAGLDEASIVATSAPPVITYVSRQTARGRMLITEHHDRLIEELYGLRDKYAYEVNVVSMEKLSREEQIRLAARTTVSENPTKMIETAFMTLGFLSDHDGRARKWVDVTPLDEAVPAHDCHGIFLPGRIYARLPKHGVLSGDKLLWMVGKHVRFHREAISFRCNRR